MKRPNFLVIMSDQHNPHILGCAGDGVVETPNLDSLAANGTTFTSAYCSSPLCVPARQSFLTSRHPSDQRVWSNSCILSQNIPTFAHSLTVAGYETVLCGRMHLYGASNYGFEKRIFGDVTAVFPGAGRNLLKPVPNYTTGQKAPAVKLAGAGKTAYQLFDAECAAAAARYLNGKGRRRPFCLVAGFVLPHNPLLCPADLFRKYEGRVRLPEYSKAYFQKLHPFVKRWRSHRQVESITRGEALRARTAYYGLVDLLDQNIGQVLQALRRSGLERDTLVVYTSDHGDMAGEHGMWWKSNFYEGSARVPLIFCCPGRLPKNKTVESVAGLVDLGPTLIALAGGEALPNARGASLAGFFGRAAAPAGWKNEAFCEYNGLCGDRPGRMLRSGDWKLNYYAGFKRPQLFNLKSDPDEMRDLAGDPRFKAVRRRLLKKVKAGWSAEVIEREVGKLEKEDIPLLVKWGQKVKPCSPYYWRPGPGLKK